MVGFVGKAAWCTNVNILDEENKAEESLLRTKIHVEQST
jgi:hypothetical protein